MEDIVKLTEELGEAFETIKEAETNFNKAVQRYNDIQDKVERLIKEEREKGR
jgi:ABC-type Fe3+-hydroxamate transport system substrate-binding protein